MRRARHPLRPVPDEPGALGDAGHDARAVLDGVVVALVGGDGAGPCGGEYGEEREEGGAGEEG